MAPGRILGVLGTLPLVLMAGCAGEPDRREPPEWLRALNPALVLEFDRVPERQVAVLLDGDLTFDEYEAATLAAISCTAERGFPLIGDVTYDRVANEFDYSIQGGPTAQGVAEAYNECLDTHVGYLGVVWFEMHKPTIAELQAAADAMSCLASAGVASYPDPATPQFNLGTHSA